MKRIVIFVLFIILSIIIIFNNVFDVSSQSDAGLFENIKAEYNGSQFENRLSMDGGFPKGVETIHVEISKNNQTMINMSTPIKDYYWCFETNVASWDSGGYRVTLTAQDEDQRTIDSITFDININGTTHQNGPGFNKTLLCLVTLIIFTLLFIVLYIEQRCVCPGLARIRQWRCSCRRWNNEIC